MSTKLTNWMREAIVKAVVQHRFAEPAMAIVARRAALAAKVYDDLYSAADQKKMAALPAGWLPEDDDLYAQFGVGGYERLAFSGAAYGSAGKVLAEPLTTSVRRFASIHTRGRCVKSYDGSHPLAVEYEGINGDQKELESQIDAATRQATAAVGSASTIKRLIDLWPEIAPFASEYEDAAKPSLPALPTDQLNALFKLPVVEAA